MYSALADAVLVVHAAIASFVVIGLALVPYGNAKAWAWVNHLGFRLAHLATIAIVVLESWAGWTCPLTTLEAWLRVQAGEVTHGKGFIEHWVGTLLFYEAPTWVFTVVYTVFCLAVVAAWWRYPPRIGRGSGSSSA